MTRRKIATQTAVIAGLTANTNYDSDEAGDARSQMIDSVIASTEEKFEEQLAAIYGHATSEDIERQMVETDPLFTGMNLEYENEN